ncbi:UNVERIFIED_CONTAM: hypothetical protein GTU68_012523, partial [Idotea baltica]|nr:hypothetical protein [Idotea baltica]
RFAPSPTGYLHLGHLVNVIYVWGIAQALDGKVILRLEDHDQTRFRPAYEVAVLDDLQALDFRMGPSDFRQSDCNDHYLEAVHTLQDKGLVYGCDCSRKDLRQRLSDQVTGEVAYDGHCRERGLPLSEGVAWRMRISIGETVFHDLLQGTQRQNPAEETGDLTIRDRNGCWTYQFAVVVDDLRHGINCVIRGMDIMASTGRQIKLAEALGIPMAMVYLHHGLLMGPNGIKLSKKHFDQDIHTRLLSGELPGLILGEAAQLAGLLPRLEVLKVDALPGLVSEENPGR